MDKLTGVYAFLCAAEMRSFVAAGRQLGVSASAVGKSVARLEKRLGVRLIHRSTRSLRLTAEGEAYFLRCRHAVDGLEEAEALLSQAAETPRGRLRVSVVTFAHRLLLPILAGFIRRHPEIELDLDFDDRIVDVIEDGFDAVIRIGELPNSNLMSRRIGAFKAGLFASPDYLLRHGTPEHPRDLERHICLRFRNHTSGKLQKWDLRVDANEIDPWVPTGLVCNNPDALMGACLNGLGIAYLPDLVAREAVVAGALAPLLASYMTLKGQLWLLWPSSRQMTPRLRVFLDYVCSTIP